VNDFAGADHSNATIMKENLPFGNNTAILLSVPQARPKENLWGI
jgi:hypothetical protein